MFKKYRFGFEPFGLLLFLAVMLPNLIWLAVPAPNDVLGRASVTPAADVVGNVCRVLFTAALVFLKRTDAPLPRFSKPVATAAAMVVCYYAGWILYYCGFTGPTVIVLLAVPPCAAFLLFAFAGKNALAAIPAAVFTVCHMIYAAANFIFPR